MRKLFNQRGGLPVFELVLLVLVLSVLGFVGYRVYTERNTANKNVANKTVASPTATPKPDPYAGWNTFSAKQEDFTLRYPNGWMLTDTSNGNCAHKVLNGSDCRERFVLSKDGINIYYVIHRDDNDDQISCGVQAKCSPDNVQSISKLDVKRLGEVSLVRVTREATSHSVNLHLPLTQSTTPKLGINQFSDFMIDYSLPSLLGGRYTVYLTAQEPSSLSADKFFAQPTVQEGIKILQSYSIK